MTAVAIAAAGERGAIIIALAQAQRDIETAITHLRNDDPTCMGDMCRAVDLLAQGYRSTMQHMGIGVVVTIPDRVWNIDEDAREQVNA